MEITRERIFSTYVIDLQYLAEMGHDLKFKMATMPIYGKDNVLITYMKFL